MYDLKVLIDRLYERNSLGGFRQAHAWSVAEPAQFWRQAWSDLGIVGNPGDVTFEGHGFLQTKWFPQANLNIVETLLQGEPNQEAIVSLAEDGPRISLSRKDLTSKVKACALALQASGIQSGDRVVAWMPNGSETMIFALGALSIGAIVSTASTDFGVAALLDRFGQIEPKLLFAATSYQYAGKKFKLEDKFAEVMEGLPSLSTLITWGNSSHGKEFNEWLKPYIGLEFKFPKFSFDHPGFILFSSGTTGKPKCIIHSAAGVLIKVLSEQGYHLDINQGDRVFYATTCGWMMWNWLLLGLGRQATIVLVDGSPAHNSLERFWKIASEEHLTFLGVSAALIETWRANGVSPKQHFALHHLKTIASTGSPLLPSGFAWVYDHVSSQVKLASIAGGTDLCGCLVLGVPTEPVPRGEIQGPALGLDVKVLRPDGTPAEPLEDGELVCCTPFPSVPLGFWGDHDRSGITGAYFKRFENIWAHGDFARMTKNGGFEILGRLDATLNSKGVRIGTAEIYRIVLEFTGVSGALAVEQKTESGTRVVLFLEQEFELTEEQINSMKSALRIQASPRHVPELIVRAPSLPKTRNGKLNELVVSDICMQRRERDSSTLLNPECLDWFRDWEKTNFVK